MMHGGQGQVWVVVCRGILLVDVHEAFSGLDSNAAVRCRSTVGSGHSQGER